MDYLNDDIREELQQELTPRELQDIESALHREYVPKPDVQAEWEKLNERVEVRDDDTDGEQPSAKSYNIRHLWSFMAGMAAAAAIFFVLTLFNNKVTDDNKAYVFSANQNTKEVLLSDGSNQMEVVSEASLDYNKETSITDDNTKEKAEKLLAVTTPRGKDYHLTLADGTQVWLNADSKLEFPKQFLSSKRKVKLTGEAYFEVVKDERHPFIVETEYFNTTVLGTTFNIKAYSEKDANIVLVDGSVKVSSKGSDMTLKPGQQATLNSKLLTLNVRDVDTYPYTQWREGFFYFEQQTLFEIMQELGRWYNVNIAFEDPQKMNLRLHFVCKRSEHLSEAIKNMNELGVVNVELTKDAVIIK